jgi:serine protease Do
MEQIVENGQVRRGRIGVSITDVEKTPDSSEPARMAGALIAEVVPGSPAERAGLQKGDVVVAVDGIPVRSAAQLRNHIGLTPIGRRVALTIQRAGVPAPLVVSVAPVASENTAQRPASRRR